MLDQLLHLISGNIRDILFGYAFFYPFLMAWVWMIGGIWFYFHWERRGRLGPDHPPVLKETPGVSVLIPCFNEEANVRDTLAYALASEYPDFEVIAINDGSSDRTGEILDELAARYDRLRVIHQATNQGKAMALQAGAIAARNEFLICIDGDAMLHPNAIHWMIFHLSSGPRVGAVTGNPRIINRSSLLGRLQVGEFSSIIGLIKRAQRAYGKIFTVSGVIAAFRRTALHRIGYWNNDMVTEDIDVSWRLQLDHWDIRYEPSALCYIYMPETFKGLWRQRLRWARGGAEVIKRYFGNLFMWHSRRFWGVALEYLASVTWAYAMFGIILLYLIGLVIPLPNQWRVETLLPQWNGMVLETTCLIQFLVSMLIDRRYEPRGNFLRDYFWVIWYPMAFWLISLITTVVAIPITIFKRRSQRARWISPDRGIRPE